MGLHDELQQALNIDKNKHTVKMTEAPKINRKDMGRFAVPTEMAHVQADLMYVKKDDEGHQYVLTVVDVATRKTDAIPLKGRTAKHVIAGFEQVWKNKIFDPKKIQYLYTDPGSEFKNKEFHEYMDENHAITVRHTMTARKNQTGVVEKRNGVLGKYLYQKMTAQELEDGHINTDWVIDLEKIVKILNKKEYLKEQKMSDFVGEPKVKPKETLLEVGTRVHVRLQQPVDHFVDDKKQLLHGGFRHGDLRWEKQTTEISNVITVPNQPVRYMVKKYKNVSFIRKELLVAEEQQPKQQEAENKPKTNRYPNMVAHETHAQAPASEAPAQPPAQERRYPQRKRYSCMVDNQ